MPFTAQELDTITNAAFDYIIKGDAIQQAIQTRPLYDALRKGQKTFPGGKELIGVNVQGAPTTAFAGYSHDDTVNYGNPAGIKRVNYAWKELHSGISVTLTELKMDGITVIDTMNSESTSQKTDREMTAITNLLDYKLADMVEGSAKSMNDIMWRDGSQSAKVFPGVQSIISLTPAVGQTGGLDRAGNVWWRNRAKVGAGGRITASAALQTLSKTLRSEVRHITKFGGKPSLLLCGSSFIDALELEVSEKGNYTLEGFVKNGKIDAGLADISMRGLGNFQYDPTLDDLGMAKFAYFIDPRHLYLDTMDGEDMKQHTPARPADKYILYRGMTYTGGLVADQLNCHGVYEVA